VSLQSPLGRVLGLGAARAGYEHWWQQRVTAVALVPLGLWFAISLLGLGTLDYPSVAFWAAQSRHAIPLILFLLALLLHSSLGLQVVVEDYVHQAATRIATLVLLKFLHVLLAVAGVYSVIMVSLGARG
jgi:succinate dehydrogenase / fumarate reductase membrane anchor subunit